MLDLARDAARAQLAKLIARADIAFAQVNDMGALSRHAHLRHISPESAAGPIPLPAPGDIVVGQTRHYGPIRALGQHTTAVLAESDD